MQTVYNKGKIGSDINYIRILFSINDIIIFSLTSKRV